MQSKDNERGELKIVSQAVYFIIALTLDFRKNLIFHFSIFMCDQKSGNIFKKDNHKIISSDS